MKLVMDLARIILLAGIILALVKISVDLEIIRYQLGG